MATAEIASASERAVLGRVRTQLDRLGAGCRVVGIRSPDEPHWAGPRESELAGVRVRIAPCGSVLAVLDALAAVREGEVTVLVTDLPESELGDAVLARLHRGKLLEADRYTLLTDLLGARAVDPRIRGEAWLVDALIALVSAEQIPTSTGATLGYQRAVGLVGQARLGLDPEQADLPSLVAAFDDVGVRIRWRELDAAERTGLTDHLVDRHGAGAGVVVALPDTSDDVLGDLLAAQVITAAPSADPRSAAAFGGFVTSRFAKPRPDREALAAAAAAAVVCAGDAPSARLAQQVRHAETALEDLGALELVVLSPVLPRGLTERLVQAAETFGVEAFERLAKHIRAPAEAHRVERVRCAARLQRWLEGRSEPSYATAVEGITDHARTLSWVDRALAQIRAGDADPRVRAVLDAVARRAGVARAEHDRTFAARLSADATTPTGAPAVETLLAQVVAPLAVEQPVLLVVVDGMSGAVAGDLAERITDRSGWSEVVRSEHGDREAVLAAFPTETTYSRTSLLCAELRRGDQATERSAFAQHPFWQAGGATLVHKAGIAGRDGADLGSELDDALGPAGRRVVGVVLNSVDDSLTSGRQSRDPAWKPEDVTGLTPLLERAAESGRVVVLTSDHGHVLEHGSELRSRPGGGARWHPGDPADDEVVVTGPRVLVPDERAVLAATEEIRFGARAHGYHGGATLAEAAIPLTVLLPPGVPVPDRWFPHHGTPPGWWDGPAHTVALPVAPAPVQKRPSKKSTPQGDGLFDLPSSGPPAGRGGTLVASAAFLEAHADQPANRVPAPEVFRAVIDALAAAGGRLPLGAAVQAAGAAGRNPRGLITTMGRVLNRDGYAVLKLADSGRAVELNRTLLDEQFPPDGAG
ncbi:MAG: BREX-2 system phosphatase PglZ [Pseudonocardia sp.]|nr:BREX-2 system phosphatase PglZ [Pseudonocardia sp.]